MNNPESSMPVKAIGDGELLALLIRFGADIIAIRDADRKLVFINDGEERTLGFTRQEIEEQRDKWDRLIHPEDVFNLKQTYEELFKNPQHQSIRFRHRHKNGGWVWLEQTRDPVVDESGKVKYVVLIARDITAQVDSGEVKLTAPESFREVFNQIPSACICYNREGTILLFNAEAERLYGYSEAEVVGKNVNEAIAPKNELNRTKEIIEQVFEGKPFRGMEWIDMRKDGSTVDVVSNLFPVYGALGEVLMCVTSNIDISALKSAERELADREAQYRSLIENIQDGVFLIQDGLFVYVNDAFASIIGHKPHEITGRHFKNFVAPDDLEMVGERYHARLRGEDVPREYEFGMRHRDGETIITVNMNVGLVQFGGKVASIGTIKDVTSKKDAEKALRDSEERFRRLSEASREGVVIHERGKIIDVNSRFAELLGMAIEEIEGKSLADFAGPESRETLEKNLVATFNEPFEVSFRRSDGKTFIAEIMGKLFPYGDKVVQISAVRDLTEYKSAMSELEKSEARFKSVAESLGEGVVIVDIESTKIVYTNRRMEELSGIKSEEVAGTQLRDSGIPIDLCEVLMAGAQKCRLGNPHSAEVAFKLADEIPAWAQVYVTPFRNEIGEIKGALGVVNDITKRKTYEESLKASEEKFRGLSEEISDGVAIVVDWRIKWGNHAFREILGFTKSEIENRKIDELFPASEVDQVKNLVVAAMLGTSIPLTRKTSAITKDGRPIVLELSAKRLRFENEDAVQIVARDITVQFIASEEMKKSERRFRELLESSNAIPWEYDYERDRFTYIGPQVEAVIGFPVDYWTGMEFMLSIIHPEDRERVRALSEEAASKGLSHELEYRILRADGRHVWIRNTISVELAGGKPKLLRGFLFEITEAKRAALLESALLSISEAAATSHTIEELATRVRSSLSTLMDVKNFFVALYDEQSGKYRFPCFTDEYDTIETVTKTDLSSSLTDYVRRTAEPILVDNRTHAKLKRDGEADLIGTPSSLWVGAPLKTDIGTLGAIVVQSYSDELLYSEKDLEVLTIVAGQVAQSIERLHAQKALAESENRFKLLAENIPGIIYLCKNDERYTMLYVNDAIETLTGHSKEEFLKDEICFADIFHPEDTPGIFRDVDDAIERKENYHLIYRIKRKDSKIVWVEEFGAGVFDGDSLLYLEGFIHDITDRALHSGKGGAGNEN